MRGVYYNKPLVRTKTRETLLGCIFIAPSMAGFLLFYFLPYMVSFYYCFTQGISSRFVGLSNFISLFQSESYRLALKNTFVFMFTGIPLIIAISFIIALLLKNAAKSLTVIVIIPLVIPAASVVAFFKILFADNGLINYSLGLLGIGSISFIDSGWSTVVLATLYIWKYFGYNTILFLTALNSISKQYYESAMLDGADRIKTLIHITIPFCVPMSFFVFIMSFVNSFKIFREVILLFGVYPNEKIYLLQHFMNNNFFSLSYQRLSTAAFLITVFIILLLTVCFKWEEKVRSNLQ